jgi:putative ABC transport system permease protein
MSVIQDVRLALRLFRQTPALTGIALLSIALGVAATAVVYTAIETVLIEPLPYAHPEQLVQIRTDLTNSANSEQSQSDWILWKDAQEIVRRTQTLQSVGIYSNALFDLAGDPSNPPEALYGLRVSASLFPTLGVSPWIGRNIREEEDQPGQAREMLLSYGLWIRRFNADRSVVGRTVKVNGEDCVVIGVMPPDFNFPLRRAAARTPRPYVEFWTPNRLDPADPNAYRGALGIIARVRQGVSLTQAQQDLASISSALSLEFPTTNRDRTFRLGFLFDRTLGSIRNSLWLLMAAAVTFLLIACANVANLLLARGVVRQREISIRMAVGAKRSRIVRQFLTESCVLAFAGGLAGYVLTVLSWELLPKLIPVTIPRLSAARVGWTTLGFAMLTALINGILFGIAPAIRAIRQRNEVSVGDLVVRDGSGTRDRVRGALVIAEVAVSLTLVVLGGQFIGKFIDLVRTDPGFEADHVLASVVLPAPERYGTPDKRALLYRRFLDAVRALPGVESAGTVDALPFSGEDHTAFVSLREMPPPNDRLAAEIDVVSTQYLQTMGIRLSEGRWFREEEVRQSSGVAIVNDVAAGRLWPGTSAIGKTICVYCTAEAPRNFKQIIGVVSSVRHSTLDGPLQANVYLAEGAFENAQFLAVRSNRPTAELEKEIRFAIAAIDPNQPVFLSTSMASLVAESIADRRFIMSLLAATGCLALLMAAAGVYGVTLYSTSRRTQELGIRVALGATPRLIHTLIFRQAFVNVVLGLGIGLVTTVLLMRTIKTLVAGFEGANPIYVLLTVGLVSLTAATACWVPARRATRIDPISALRKMGL